MGDVIFGRIRSGNRVVFVYLTAGDDGRDSLYWKTRERAALKSTDLAARTLSDVSAPGCGVVQVLNHPIRKCDRAQTSSYFLRLPDGKRNGDGFGANHDQSLRKLRAGRIKALDALDGSTTYDGWDDLRKTVSALIFSGDSASMVLETMDPSIARNPHDHFDHRMAGILTTEIGLRRNQPIIYYVGYALATRAANRSADQVQMKTELFTAYNREMLAASPAWGAYREHPAFYSQCMQRTYSKTYPSAKSGAMNVPDHSHSRLIRSHGG